MKIIISIVIVFIFVSSYPARAQLSGINTGPSADAPYQQLPPPGSSQTGARASKLILSGKWSSSTGKGYELGNGDFWRNNYLNMRLACSQRTDVKTITPSFNCAGDWYNNRGEAKGGYKGTLYWDGSGQRWYLEGQSNYYTDPDRWGAWNFGQVEGPNGAKPSADVLSAQRGTSDSNTSVVPSGQDGTAVLSGKWSSSTGKGYELGNGDFWRNNYLNMRLACSQRTDVKTITPSFNCAGDWYNNRGEAKGGYKGTLYWDGSGQRWYLEGQSNYYTDPDRWGAWSFGQIEGPGGIKPSPDIIQIPIVDKNSSANDQNGQGADQSSNDIETNDASESDSGNGSVSLGSVLSGEEDPELTSCLKRAYQAMAGAGLIITQRAHYALIAHDAYHDVRIRCPKPGVTSTTSVSVVGSAEHDPITLRDQLLEAM